jgi:GNAT superfamily N-acetyltransferase
MCSLRDAARRIEHAQASGTAVAARMLAESLGEPAYGAEPVGDGWLILAPREVPLWGVKGAGFEAPLEARDVERVEDLCRQRGLPARFDLCALADGTLGDRLAARGYAASPSCEVWMRAVGEPDPPAQQDPEVRTEPVDGSDADAVTRFAEVVSRGFRGGEDPDAWNVAIGRNSLRRPGRHAFLAYVDGALAGGGLVTVTDGLASFIYTSTLPAFRRRGAQGALMRARLGRAREAGADTVCVQCEPGSPTARNAARLGFGHAYTRTFFTRPA